MKKWFFTLFALTLPSTALLSQTIAEKKAGTAKSSVDLSREMQQFLIQINKEIKERRVDLHKTYALVQELFTRGAPPSSYQELLTRINEIRASIASLEETWRSMATESGHQDAYALWHQPDTTIGDLVMDFGSQSFVYMIPSDIANMKLSINSNLPIPRSSWNEMLELILTQNGIGVRQLNPYLRQLFLLQEDKSGLKLMTDRRSDLEIVSPQTRVAFVITPEPADLRRIWTFLQRFSNPNSTVLQAIGRDIFMIGSAAEVKELLKLYDFVASHKGDKEYKAIPISAIEADEMAQILASIFDQLMEEPQEEGQQQSRQQSPQQRPLGPPQRPGQPPQDNQRPGQPPQAAKKPKTDVKRFGETVGLRIIPLSTVTQALFLVGTKEEIRKAEEIIRAVESQIGEAREKTIYTYRARHSDPEELAEVLQKIYDLMISTGVGFVERPLRPGELPAIPSRAEAGAGNVNVKVDQPSYYKGDPYREGFYQQGSGYLVNPAPAVPGGPIIKPVNRNRNNFLVDQKTSNIVMVVELDILPKMKELIKKLDVPKKQVQIEVLLFEKRLNRQSDFGLNLLRITQGTPNKNSGIRFNNIVNNPPGIDLPSNAGLFQFFIHHVSASGIPIFDMIYTFLLSQDDILINSSPSVVTQNMTPATIVINEEISIDTGIFEVPTTGDFALKQSFTRAQYGITIQVTPIVHMRQPDDMEPDVGECFDEGTSSLVNYVTMATDITFDTIKDIGNNRPDVTRRHLVNEVSVPEGQTVIIGGLRRRVTTETKDAVPFLGELPGVGRLFSDNTTRDEDTEMFLFITPKIISDPVEDFERIRRYEMTRRPGDIPEFLCRLYEAREIAKNRILDGTMRALFGHEPERCAIDQYEFERLDPFEQLQQYRVIGPGVPPNPEVEMSCDMPALPMDNGRPLGPVHYDPNDFEGCNFPMLRGDDCFDPTYYEESRLIQGDEDMYRYDRNQEAPIMRDYYGR